MPEKNPYPPPYGRSSEIPRGRGDLKAKIVEAKCEANLEFPGERCCGGRGGGVPKQQKKPSVGGILIFYGTAQFMAKLDHHSVDQKMCLVF